MVHIKRLNTSIALNFWKNHEKDAYYWYMSVHTVYLYQCWRSDYQAGEDWDENKYIYSMG